MFQKQLSIISRVPYCILYSLSTDHNARLWNWSSHGIYVSDFNRPQCEWEKAMADLENCVHSPFSKRWIRCFLKILFFSLLLLLLISFGLPDLRQRSIYHRFIVSRRLLSILVTMPLPYSSLAGDEEWLRLFENEARPKLVQYIYIQCVMQWTGLGVWPFLMLSIVYVVSQSNVWCTMDFLKEKSTRLKKTQYKIVFAFEAEKWCIALFMKNNIFNRKLLFF